MNLTENLENKLVDRLRYLKKGKVCLFAVVSGNKLDTTTCKEIMVASLFNDYRLYDFIYVHNYVKPMDKAIGVINEIERQIGLKESKFYCKKVTVGYPTGENREFNVMEVHFSKAWKRNRVTMSIFLECLRSATTTKRNYISKLLKLIKKIGFTNYFRKTTDAAPYDGSSYTGKYYINRFLCLNFMRHIDKNGIPQSEDAKFFVKESFRRDDAVPTMA